VRAICGELDRGLPRVQGSHAALITSVADRPGHDRRYALDAGKLRAELDWSPARDFAQGLRDTVGWYLDHPQWIAAVGSAPNRSAAAVHQEQA
jgi:dTDP-glucose 4,6-dehydratase